MVWNVRTVIDNGIEGFHDARFLQLELAPVKRYLGKSMESTPFPLETLLAYRKPDITIFTPLLD